MKADHVNSFIGATIDLNPVVVTPYCSKGSVKDVLANDDIKLDTMFISSILADTVRVSLQSIFLFLPVSTHSLAVQVY